MHFTKMQGIGNDYVYVDTFNEHVGDPSSLSRRVSDRHLGIGSDGLVLIGPSDKADCSMRIFNADGSEGEMCGNAIRCVGKYVYEHGLIRKEDLTVDTLAGIRKLKLLTEGDKVTGVVVDMGKVKLISELPEKIIVNGELREFVGISLGNPHAVYLCDDPDELDLEDIGPVYEHHSRFPERVNTEFVRVCDRGHIRMRVWERGSGETLACGTGAAASAAACILLGLTDDDVEVMLRGGTLDIHWGGPSEDIYMTGPAVEVFSGEIN